MPSALMQSQKTTTQPDIRLGRIGHCIPAAAGSDTDTGWSVLTPVIFGLGGMNHPSGFTIANLAYGSGSLDDDRTTRGGASVIRSGDI
jgi:hypothetical protein